MKNATQWQRIGAVFQLPMMLLFMALLLVFREQSAAATGFLPLRLVGNGGAVIFVWCLWYLYIRKARLTGLITEGPFRYTRHPMYLGLFLMNVCYWSNVAVVWTSPLFLALEAAFIIAMVVAGYCQEQETLARFGQPARDYYDRTPRIPFSPW